MKAGSEGLSVTTIYELLLELGVIEKKKNGYTLFRKLNRISQYHIEASFMMISGFLKAVF